MLAQDAAAVQQTWPFPDQSTNKPRGHPGRRQTKGKNDPSRTSEILSAVRMTHHFTHFWIFGLNVEFWHEAAKYNVITWQSGSGSIPVSHLVHLQAQFTPGFNVLLGWSDHQESSSQYASRTWSEMVRATCGSVHPRHVLKEHFNQEGTFSHYLVPCGSNLAFMVY